MTEVGSSDLLARGMARSRPRFLPRIRALDRPVPIIATSDAGETVLRAASERGGASVVFLVSTRNSTDANAAPVAISSASVWGNKTSGKGFGQPMDSLFQDREAWEIAHAMLRCYGERAVAEVRRRMDGLGPGQRGARESWRSVLRATVWLDERIAGRSIRGEEAPIAAGRLAA
jgi:hypothetical protein